MITNIPVRLAGAAPEPYRRALLIAIAALQVQPKIGHAYGAEHRTTHAFALTTLQSAVAMDRGAPFDPDNSDLVTTLNASRDAILDLLDRTHLAADDPVRVNAVDSAHRLIAIVGARQ